MDYNETLLESIQLLIDSSLASQQRDEIVRCRITDIAERDKGHYKVTSSDLVIFDAYSEKTTYRLDEEVNVLIPKNDQNKRQILGRYVSQQDQPITYVSGKEKLVSVEPITLIQADKGEITANGNTEKILIGRVYKGLGKSHLFNIFHIQADFKTLLSQYANTMRSGRYGLLALCYFAFDDDSALPAAAFELSSDHMFGNPYNYMTYFTQEYIFNYDISVPFERIDLYLFQDNNFQYFDGKKLERVPESNTPNILVSNIEMSFAYDVSNYDNQTVEIKTSDILEYTNSDLYKNINLIWYNKTPENKYLGFSDGDFAEAAVKPVGYIESAQKFTQNEGEELKGFYYLQDMGYTQFFSEEKYEPGDKVYYTKKTYSDDEKSTIDGLAPEKPQYKIEWLVDNAEGVLTPQVANDKTVQSFELECRKDLTNTEVQAIIYRDGVVHKSNILKFENKSIYDNNVSNLDISLDFKHLDNSLPAYAFYGQNNQLIDSTERFKRRRVQATWNSSAGDVSSAYWKGATIAWSIPKNATMILPSPNQGMQETEEGKYTFSKTIETGADEEFQFEYLINSVFYANYINNQIECTLSLPGDRGTAHGILSLAFSSFGTSGTSYTFIISPQKNKFPWTEYGENITTTASFGATLVDKNGEILNIDSIKWQYPYEKITVKEDKTCEVTLSTLNDYTVLEASVEQEWGGKTTTLTATYPIVFSNDGKYYAQAPSEILYDSFGSLMNINFAPLKLFNLDSQEEIKDAIWSICYTDPNNKLFAPAISYNSRTEEYTIVPPVMYVGNAPKVILRAKAQDQDNTILWQTPLVLTQYKYGSPVLNDWNGELNIDNNNNYILSSMLGAGKKNNDNTFSGVLMGEVGNQLGTSSEGIGLYGYDHGAQAFGFKEDGTAFIGKSGTGRIQFDGNEGIIASASWYDASGLREEGPENGYGVRIDLKDGNLRLDKDDEFLHFDDEGLKIRVNSLEITSNLKGVNLFKNPAPENRQDFGWWYGEDEKAQFTEIESYSAIALHGTKALQQQLDNLIPGKTYCITFDKYIQQQIITSNSFHIQIIDCNTQKPLYKDFQQMNNNYFTFTSPGKSVIIQIKDNNYTYIPTYNDWYIWDDEEAKKEVELKVGVYDRVKWYGVTPSQDNKRFIHYNLDKLNTLKPSFAFRVHRATQITVSLYKSTDVENPIASITKDISDGSKEVNLFFDFDLTGKTNLETELILAIKGTVDDTNNNKTWWFLPIGVLVNHLKLELGETPTSYYYDISNYMINKISSDQQGIYLDQNQLFINASSIATGALMSQNWINSGGSYGYNEDKKTDGILSSGENGLAIDLINGEINTNMLSIVNSDYSSVGISKDSGFVIKDQNNNFLVQLSPTTQFIQSADYEEAIKNTEQVLYYYKTGTYKQGSSYQLNVRQYPPNGPVVGTIQSNEQVDILCDSSGNFIYYGSNTSYYYIKTRPTGNEQQITGYVYYQGVNNAGRFDIEQTVKKKTTSSDQNNIKGCKVNIKEGTITIGDGANYIIISAKGIQSNLPSIINEEI